MSVVLSRGLNDCDIASRLIDMRKVLWLSALILLSACDPLGLGPKDGRPQPPADWQPMRVDKVTIHLPPNAKEIVPADPPGTKVFQTGTLELRITRSQTDSKALDLISQGESRPNEERVSLDGKSLLITHFKLQSTSGQNYAAVAVIFGVYKDGPQNEVLWAKGYGPEDQELAKKIFLTAHVSP